MRPRPSRPFALRRGTRRGSGPAASGYRRGLLGRPVSGAVNDADRLPASYAGLPNGHYGSHQFLAVDFIEACTTGRRPSTTVWDAARYCAPGIVADASSRTGGTVMEVPSFPKPGRRASLDR
jgi:hypothetical protein